MQLEDHLKLELNLKRKGRGDQHSMQLAQVSKLLKDGLAVGTGETVSVLKKKTFSISIQKH